MSTERVLLSAEQFAGVAAGYGDAGAMAVLAAGQLAKRKTLIAAVLRAARPTEFAVPLSAAAELITRAEAAAPDAVAEVLAHPHLDAWAMLCLHRLADRAEDPDVVPAEELRRDLGHLASYAVAAAVAAGLDFDLEVPTVDGAATVPGLGYAAGLGAGWARAEGGPAGVRFTGAGGAVVERDGPGWQARRAVDLGDGFRLAIEDQDPYRHCYQWRPLPPLAEGPARDLAKLLRDAWGLIEHDHPRHAVAIRHSLRSLVPLAPAEGGTMISAASRQACGSIGASIPDTAADLALLLIHEYMHAKLGALLDVCDLHRRGPGAGLFAPWRVDPRPAGALLQGIYAHAGVTDYWRQRRHGPDADTRRAAAQFAYWRAMNRLAIEDLIGSGELTPAGMEFAGRLRVTLDGWEGEEIAAGIASRTQLFVTAQTVRWLLINARPAEDEVDRLAEFARSGAPTGAFAARGTIVAGATRGAAGAPGILGELHRWLDGRVEPLGPSGPDSGTPGALLLNGDSDGAAAACLARLDADAGDDDAWIGLAVARSLAADRRPDLSDPSDLATRLVVGRPELMRNAVFKLQHAGCVTAATDLVKRLAGQVATR